MEIVKLEKEYKDEVIRINQATVSNLTNPDLYIPFSQEDIEKAFGPTDEVMLYGVICNGVLAAVSGLFFDISDLAGEGELQHNEPAETAEIGACMTLPEFRSKGYMLALNRKLTEIARQRGITRLVATAHPENSASNRSLEKLGMKRIKEFYRYGRYLRNLFVMDI
ncbi:MAG: GNAT family N-acetyltransferase [Bacteroides sp.]|nr:GNAT family N-acetyltransferase [Bacteroides sp.]